MRKIKFRGRDNDDRWYYGDLTHFSDGDVGIFDQNNTTNTVDPETVGEFVAEIGGVEYWEGDKIRYSCIKRNANGLVSSHDNWVTTISHNPYQTGFYPFCDVEVTKIEKLDNPEIMEGN